MAHSARPFNRVVKLHLRVVFIHIYLYIFLPHDGVLHAAAAAAVSLSACVCACGGALKIVYQMTASM